ncbi:peptide chain release factor N(5)-glutamine methyltransferase [candidate division NPL-UPA2 bacterium]|nr:peptide chain release factor N(5)-glutamine methyltransferase [candidate division NPL-UPA2 bacterium]
MKSQRLIDALEWGSNCLEEEGIENPRRGAEFLLLYLLGWTQTHLYLNAEAWLRQDDLSAFQDLIRRRAQHFPLQYLTGRTEFRGGEFLVNQETMIPRPETEILVDGALKKLRSINREPLTVIDVGTGCGNIAITLAKSLPCRVYATDISAGALRAAAKNAQASGVDIIFLRGDLFGPIEELGLEGKVDLVISNPPYIATGDFSALSPEVSQFEPRLALDGGKDGLKFYPPIIKGAARYLKASGYLALEMGAGQAEKVKKLILENGHFQYPEIIKDYSGIDRVIIAEK